MDTALVAIVWIALFVVGPPALLIWPVRQRRRREREAAAQAQLPPAESAIALDAKEPAQGAAMVAAAPESATEQRGNGTMFPYGVPLVLYPLLAVGIASVRAGWMAGALAIVTGLIALAFIRLAFNKKDFERARNNDPGLAHQLVAVFRAATDLAGAVRTGALAAALRPKSCPLGRAGFATDSIKTALPLAQRLQ